MLTLDKIYTTHKRFLTAKSSWEASQIKPKQKTKTKKKKKVKKPTIDNDLANFIDNL